MDKRFRDAGTNTACKAVSPHAQLDVTVARRPHPALRPPAGARPAEPCRSAAPVPPPPAPQQRSRPSPRRPSLRSARRIVSPLRPGARRPAPWGGGGDAPAGGPRGDRAHVRNGSSCSMFLALANAAVSPAQRGRALRSTARAHAASDEFNNMTPTSPLSIKRAETVRNPPTRLPRCRSSPGAQERRT